MEHLHFKRSFFYSFIFLFFFNSSLAEEIDEIVVEANWREAKVVEEDSSVIILNKELLKNEPIKNFESLSYLIPNLNFSASDSRARYFQIRGIGERSGYQGTPNTSVGFLN